jgi:hypothetical protein
MDSLNRGIREETNSQNVTYHWVFRMKTD